MNINKKILKNRTILGVICIVLSLIICFLLTPLFANTVKSQVEIVRVIKNIEEGTEITKDMLEVVKVGGYNLPSNVITNEIEIIGKYAKTDFVVGDYFIGSKLSSTPLTEFSYLTELDGSKQAISITIKSFASGLSGKLEAGDIVRIIATDAAWKPDQFHDSGTSRVGDFRETISPNELQYVKVLAVTDSLGYDKEFEQSNGEEKELPVTLTLLVDQKQAEILAEYETNSKIHVTLVYRGEESFANSFLEAQDDYIYETYYIEDEEDLDDTEDVNKIADEDETLEVAPNE